MRNPTRRRLLQITAGCAAFAGASTPKASRFRWTGSALGAVAALDLYLPDRVRASRLVPLVVAEIDRLEGIFSLQRSSSSISILNRDGRLVQPPLDLVTVLETARMFSEFSDGAFDVTVQPLWRLHADAAARGEVPDGRTVKETLGLVRWRSIEVERRSIILQRRGMAVTLNGIAQGYISDRVAGLLLDAGVDDVLVDLGEQRASSRRTPGHTWRLDTPVGRVQLANRSLAVSRARAIGVGQRHHLPNLISPVSGQPLSHGRCIAVTAPSALFADGASTSLAAALSVDVGTIGNRLSKLGITMIDSDFN